jgi:two-component system chemotaxis sensor kinase CheA
MDFTGSAAEIFIIEAKELLAKMEEILLKMEQGEQNSDFVNNIFRSAHTLKGAAAMFNFTELSSFAHEIENLLSIFRESKAAISKSKIAILLDSVDCLTSLLNESTKGNVSANVIARKQELIKQLKDNKVNESITNAVSFDSKKKENLNGSKRTNDSSNEDLVVAQNQLNIEKESVVVDNKSNILKEPVAPDNKSNISKESDANHLINIEPSTAAVIVSKNFIKVESEKLDEIINLIGELVIAQSHLNNVIKDNTFLNEELVNTVERLFNLTDDLRTISLQLRMLPIKEIFSKFNRVVRDIATQQNKQIKLQIIGAETELDKSIIEKINDPLLHLIRNACDHGIDAPEDRVAAGKPTCGLVTLEARQENSEIIIKTSDDGRGIDLDRVKQKAIQVGLIKKDAKLSEQEVMACIFEPGFSTSEQVTDLSGRGVGMDVVKKEIERLHGSVKIDSKKMLGTTISIRLPLTLAIIDGLLIKITNFPCVIPMWNVKECIEITPDDYQSIVNNNYINFRNKVLPSIILSHLLGINGKKSPSTAIIVQHADYKVGVIVDSLEGEIQTIIKPIPDMFSKVRWINGAAVLGNGEVAVILDLPGLITNVIEKHKTNLNEVAV